MEPTSKMRSEMAANKQAFLEKMKLKMDFILFRIEENEMMMQILDDEIAYIGSFKKDLQMSEYAFSVAFDHELNKCNSKKKELADDNAFLNSILEMII